MKTKSDNWMKRLVKIRTLMIMSLLAQRFKINEKRIDLDQNKAFQDSVILLQVNKRMRIA